MISPPSKLDKAGVHKLLTDSSTHGFTLLTVLLFQYDEELFAMDSLDLYARIHDDFGVQLNQVHENRIQAMLTALTTDGYTHDPATYESIVKALTEGDPDLQGASGDIGIDEMLWSEYQIQLAMGLDSPDDIDYHPAVQAFRTLTEQQDKVQNPDEFDNLAEELQELQTQLYSQLHEAGFSFPQLPDLG
jgi:hypothetical protein